MLEKNGKESRKRAKGDKKKAGKSARVDKPSKSSKKARDSSKGAAAEEVLFVKDVTGEAVERESLAPPVLLVDSEDETPALPTAPLGSGNSLTENSDFIAFDSSSEGSDAPSDLDPASPYMLNDESSQHSARHALPYPWIRNHDHSSEKEIADWLTLEIRDFIAYVSPSAAEITDRNAAIRRIRNGIRELWPESELHVFGSYATDMYLPGSDIDMVVTSEDGESYTTRSALYQLLSHLKQTGLGTKVEPLAHTRVPIIKFVDPHTGLNIDLLFERRNGIEAAETIRKWIEVTPGLRELSLVVKQFLASRRLNNVHLGGLGGYATICLVYLYLQLHPRVASGSIDPLRNLGTLLIEFFELYGRNFGYDDVVICVGDPVCYARKRDHPGLSAGRNPFSLVVQDPGDKLNNISRGSYNIRDLKKAFTGAYELLCNRCYDMKATSYKKRLNQSILGDVIRYRGKERDFNDERGEVVNEALARGSEYQSVVSGRKVQHQELYTEEDLDEVTVEEVKVEKRKKKKKKAESVVESVAEPVAEPAAEQTPVEPTPDPALSSQIRSLLGVESDSDEPVEIIQETTLTTQTETTRSVSKETKRDYWAQKGGMGLAD